MSQLRVTNLTFSYEGSFDTIFEDVSFAVDTAWKLGFLGRNGKGKTTFAGLLTGRLKGYTGTITNSGVVFDYFPYKVTQEQLKCTASELMDSWKAGCEDWKVICELSKLNADAEILYRPMETLSHGERTKVMLAVLFSGENDFLIIDEPTNHLDHASREILKGYLNSKKGFILISHDRDLLDAVIDHVLVLNRKSIEVAAGNFSQWWDNKQKADQNARSENEKHLKEIASLQKASERVDRWAQKNEATKIGFDPIKEHDRFLNTRSFIGAKTKKMQSRVKSFEVRMQREIEEKEGLLQDIEENVSLKIMPLVYHKEVMVRAVDHGHRYPEAKEFTFRGIRMEIRQGDRIFLKGSNGCGKSTLIREILKCNETGCSENTFGELSVGSGLIISYISQDTSYLRGTIREYAKREGLEESLLFAIMRQLDMPREQFLKPMEEFSEGQKKKVLIASSLIRPAHLYIWDEPLNYIDVFSRMQIEELILTYEPTMLIVDHDMRFQEKIATNVIHMDRAKND